MAKIAKFKDTIAEGWVKSRLYDLISNAFPLGESALCGVPNLGLADPADITYVFNNFIDADCIARFKKTESGTPTLTIDDVDGGVLKIANSATSNHEAFYYTPKVFTFKEGRPIWFEVRIKAVEKNTNKLGLIVGITDAWGAGLLANSTAAPKSTYSGFMFYKKSGDDMKLYSHSSNTTTQEDNELRTHVSNTYYKLGMFFNGKKEVENITVWLDDKEVAKHTIDISTPIGAGAGFGVKSTSATAEEIHIDYIVCVQLR